MAIVTLAELRAQLAFTADLGTVDDVLLAAKLEAAQGHVERLLGFRIAERFGGTEQPPVPPALAEAVSQLAAYWYEVREAASEAPLREIPFGVAEITREFRDWSF